MCHTQFSASANYFSSSQETCALTLTLIRSKCTQQVVYCPSSPFAPHKLALLCARMHRMQKLHANWRELVARRGHYSHQHNRTQMKCAHVSRPHNPRNNSSANMHLSNLIAQKSQCNMLLMFVAQAAHDICNC